MERESPKRDAQLGHRGMWGEVVSEKNKGEQKHEPLILTAATPVTNTENTKSFKSSNKMVHSGGSAGEKA